LNVYYKNNAKYIIERDTELHEQYADIVSRYTDRKFRILDIGCSTGHLLFLLKNKGYLYLTGIDPSTKCKKIAKDKYGIRVINKDLLSFLPKKKFDCVMLTAVLEHLNDLKKCFNKIEYLLEDNGVVFISVPDIESFNNSVTEPFGEFSTEHINFFSFTHLQLLLTNFDCIFCMTDKNVLYTMWKRKRPSEEYIKNYIYVSRNKEQKLAKFINKLPDDLFIWGVGALTQRLMISTNLQNKVCLFIETDVTKKKKFVGFDIIQPTEIGKKANPILICSFRFQKEIQEQINTLGLKNIIYLLPKL